MTPSFHDACIVGLGPAGIGAALTLAKSQLAPGVLCLEAGVDVSAKFCSILQRKGCRMVHPCQMVSGIGGSSVLSGGKISGYPAGRAMSVAIGNEEEVREKLTRAATVLGKYLPLISPNISKISRENAETKFREAGFEYRYYDAFLYRQRELVVAYQKMLHEIQSSGTKVLVNTTVEDISKIDGGFLIRTSSGNSSRIFTKRVILAVGRFGIDLMRTIEEDLSLGMEANHIDLGVRLEFPTSLWPDIDSCHKDLKLHFGPARTFCVCKDGMIAPYRFSNIFLVEGTSDPELNTGLTNLGISLRYRSEGRLEERSLLQALESRHSQLSNGIPIRQRLWDFLAERPSTELANSDPASIDYWRWSNANACFPQEIAAPVRDAVNYFASRFFPREAQSHVYVFAPLADYYWPRFPGHPGFRSRIRGLYLVGDCLGHFRGILQAFCSGLVCGETIVRDS